MAGRSNQFPKTKYKPGDKFGKLTLVELTQYRTPSGLLEWRWIAECECGEICYIRERSLPKRIGCISCTAAISAIKKQQIEHQGLKNRKYKEYLDGALKRGLPFELTFDQFINLFEQNCHYCGAEPRVHEGELQYMNSALKPYRHNGIDRVDTSKGYTLDNCVPCCSICNYAKHDLKESDFYDWIHKAHYFLKNKSSQTIPEGSTSQANGGGNGTLRSNSDEDIVESI